MTHHHHHHHHDKHSGAHAEVVNAPHKSKLTHQLVAAAASYEAMKMYEKHVAKQGHPDDHAKAKELIAAFSGAFVDRIVETKGLDFIDKRKAKHDATAHADNHLPAAYPQQYSY
ncbi:hypothetical protein CONPUDRAFT_85787 [Coniophora puteana RWD-64-598 SS2]|uniref:Uncharacterized protein n=1 Tax=Coniophora puteana (strain RWD-64-598) TaxID=741705 RepID=R7SFX3_CONPW|nr:uncharacterized protein CONPUDRAFT_85787 [Coniophora puteana RWD-64-598 SS2]EIW74642.1 hypothetical protein CONPUDRAFT_85787 [Coniophora puteana RWD-64-598 SS2]